jgi:glycerophosphoryl diester phosphodiesterase
MGPREVTLLWLAARGWPWPRSPAACVQVPPAWKRVTVVDRRLLAAAHRRGLQVHVWTIDDEGEMARLLDLGVDGVMTDRPTALRGLLAARGQWPSAG